MSITRRPSVPMEHRDERPEQFNHLNLPFTDDKPVDNNYQPMQSMLLTSALKPHFDRLYPEGDYFMGVNSGIYWKLTRPRLDGCKAPDWYMVHGVPHMLDGEIRRSYVLWQEHQHPALVMEFVSGNGREEHDGTPNTGKFWVYERAIRAEHYVIWDPFKEQLEVYRLVNRRYRSMKANAADRIELPTLQMELGSWKGTYLGNDFLWLRSWDRHGRLLPVAEEAAETAQARAETEKHRAETEKHRADKFAAKLRELGIAPDDL